MQPDNSQPESVDLADYDEALGAAPLDLPISEGHYTARLAAFRVKTWKDKATGIDRHGMEWKLTITTPGDTQGQTAEKFSSLSEKAIPFLKKESARCFGADIVKGAKMNDIAAQYKASEGKLFKITVKPSNTDKPNVYLDGMVDETDRGGEIKPAEKTDDASAPF